MGGRATKFGRRAWIVVVLVGLLVAVAVFVLLGFNWEAETGGWLCGTTFHRADFNPNAVKERCDSTVNRLMVTEVIVALFLGIVRGGPDRCRVGCPSSGAESSRGAESSSSVTVGWGRHWGVTTGDRAPRVKPTGRAADPTPTRSVTRATRRQIVASARLSS